MVKISNYDEYIQLLIEYKREYGEEIWFRGHASQEWELRPNLFRNAISNISKSKEEIVRYKKFFPDFLEAFKEFKIRIEQEKLLDISDLNDFHLMFLAQHYGLLTPLLDWSTDPLVALFFATEPNEWKENEYPVIYILKPGECNKNSGIVYDNGESYTNINHPLDIDKHYEPMLECLYDMNDSDKNVANIYPICVFSSTDYAFRICRQSGKFTFHGPLERKDCTWEKFEFNKKRVVECISIMPEAIKGIKEALNVLNINRDTIYGDDGSYMDECCKAIREESEEKFKDLVQEFNKIAIKYQSI